MSMLHFLKNAFLELGAIDLRAMALFRLVMGCAMLLNIALFWPDAVTFFEDVNGLYLRSESMSAQSMWRWSLLWIGGSPLYIHLFFALHLLAALAFLLGYRTRLATVLCWVCAVSLKHRGLMLGSLADTQMPILLFWAMFLPIGARFSIDAALARQPLQPNRYISVASFAVLLNVMYLYFIGALEKTGAPWVTDFTAVHYAIRAVEFTAPLAPWLVTLAWLAEPLTRFVYWVELLSPLFLFLPFLTQWGRLIGVPLLMSLHIGFLFFLSIGIFPLVSLSGLCLFVPALYWDRMLRWYNRLPRRRGIAIFYDRDCGFCEKTCHIFKSLGLPPETRITPAQHDAHAGPILERTNSWVVKTHDGRWLTRWDAVSYVWRRSLLLSPLGWLFWLPGFRQLGNGIYALIARYRSRLGTVTERFLPWRETGFARPHALTSLLLAILIPFSLIWSIQWIIPKEDRGMPYWLTATMNSLSLTQRWNMYAPNSTRSSKWVIAEGLTASGKQVDAMHQSWQAPVHERPAHGWDIYPTFRWRKLFDRVKWKAQGSRVASHFCRAWTQRFPEDPLKEVTFTGYRQHTALPGTPETFPVRLYERRYGCP